MSDLSYDEQLSEIERLRVELKDTQRVLAHNQRQHDGTISSLAAANAEIESMKHIIEVCSANFDTMVEERNQKDIERERADAAESQLADANALLAEMAHERSVSPLWRGRVVTHLTGQPAAECKCVGCRNGFAYCEVLDGGKPVAPTRVDAEQAVLDAAANLMDYTLTEGGLEDNLYDLKPLAAAELARRRIVNE